MPAVISGTDPDSIACQLGFKKGDTLESINGHEITDVIDYMYYSECENLAIKALCGGQAEAVKTSAFSASSTSFRRVFVPRSTSRMTTRVCHF